MGLTPIPQNYKRNVDWIIGAYEDAGVDFPNGFQKDAIQNAVGARRTNNWKNWKCDISYIENNKGKFIVVSDSGTMGLTGKNTPAEEINEMMAREETLPAKKDYLVSHLCLTLVVMLPEVVCMEQERVCTLFF